ncbi:MAG: Stk1 family PASTA domain-containing Ser/Thr kinase [Candidatus Nanopelagicales bacterium]|nr:Stk1 family PASTA domain-containing Ser/Thr kinase [Candidatus Nanopelagicales bacterium]MDZ4248768.1 Stk1 family PASTA domain-containing Ser/Thr kinase [Candidatus Nanopelagicales bacterium]
MSGSGPTGDDPRPEDKTPSDLPASPIAPTDGGKIMLGDRYEIGETLGRGGMAEVHEAYDLRLGRRVAVKILRPELARDSSFQQRFRREAHSAAALNHPNIVAVYDTGEDILGSGPSAVTVPYIVMEYVDGMTLRQLLASGRRLLPERALEITSGVLAALDYSHRHGIVHRDIKPANVMLTKTGEVKVMDFGIARALAAHGQTMTATSQVMGTAQYLSPEQARGEVVDARSDLYSTGCVLYELLTGRPPFTGESPVSVAYQHVSEQPIPPSQIDSQVLPQTDTVVLRALAKNPDDRYQTAADFKADVDRAVVGAPVTAPVPVISDPEPTAVMPPVLPPPGAVTAQGPTRQKKSPWLWVGVVVGILLLVAGSVALAQSLFGNAKPESVTVPRVVGMTVQEAQNALNSVGLRVGTQTAEKSNKEPGKVLSQDPAEGESVEKGQAVNLSVSGGPGQTVVPNVVGMTSSDAARQALELNELKLGNVEERDSDQPKGYVLSQSPPQGTQVQVGTEVNITVSNGLVTVPKVLGNTESQARTALGNVGLDVNVIEESSSSPAGTVIAQSPNAGNKVQRGSTVTITIATAPTDAPNAEQGINDGNPDRQGQSGSPKATPPPEAEGDTQD